MKPPARHLLASTAVVLLLCLPSTHAFADYVVPSDPVVNGVNVRESPSTNSISKGLLRPGDKARFIGSVPSWYFVELPDGTKGYVCKSWTELVVPPE